MTREHKLALIFGFALVLVVGILISDHFSGARLADLEQVAQHNATNQPLLSPTKPLPTQSQPTVQQHQLATAQQSQIAPDQPLDQPTSTKPQQEEPFYTIEAIQEYAREHGLEFTRSLPIAARTQPTLAKNTPTQTPDDNQPVTARAIVVQQGDSLWKLTQNATGDGHLYPKLAAFNADRLDNTELVHPGMTLLIPDTNLLRAESIDRLKSLGQFAIAVDSPTQTAAITTDSPPRANDATYTVKPGDVLSVICQRELGTIRRLDDVLALNRDVLNSPDSIRVGMVLKLPERH